MSYLPKPSCLPRRVAKLEGLTSYVGEHACKRCGTLLRFVSNRDCLQCSRNRKKLNYEKRKNGYVSFGKSNLTGYRGVSRSGIRYKAMKQIKGDRIYLGSFDTPEEAHAAYLAEK